MKDQISALMDHEMDVDDAEHLFAALRSGGEASECWRTYHMIGDVMRGTPMFKVDFNQRLMQQLEQEPMVLAPQAARSRLKPKPVFFSIAASVAAVLFVGWMVLQQQVQHGSDIQPVEIAQNVPSEYLLAHQASVPSSSAYYIEPASYSENAR